MHPQHGSHTVVSSPRVEVVFSTWTGVCFSGGGAVRESQSSLEHAPVPQSHTRCCERQGEVAVGVCTPLGRLHDAEGFLLQEECLLYKEREAKMA